jgi:glycosyltransferase involved in cell wall biosynthesis
MSVKLSVITVTHNRCALLQQKLAALAAQTLAPERFELVVLVNACTDGTLRLLEGAATPYRVRVLVSGHKLSPACARNLCAQAAAGDTLYFSDDDCLPAPETLAKHLAAQEQVAWAIGGLEFIADGRHEFWRPLRVDFWNLNGANTSVPADYFRTVGGFDETLCGVRRRRCRARVCQLKHLPFVALPDALAQHLGPNPRHSGNLEKARSAGCNAQRLAGRYPSLAYRLGVHWGLLPLKRFVLLGPLRHLWRLLAPQLYTYERAYLLGALEEKRRD